MVCIQGYQQVVHFFKPATILKLTYWVDNKWNRSVLSKSSMETNDTEAYSFPTTEEGGGDASSMITEEPHEEVTEMDQLDTELESELQKLHVSKPEDLDLEFNQSRGVMPYELDQKLCRLLIEQQESQIVDLESELRHTNCKLLEKESELQVLKDCVKRLTEFYLTCPSALVSSMEFEAITGIALPSRSNKLFCGSKDKSLRVWDCNSGQCGVVVDFDDECGTLVNEGPWIFVGLRDMIKAWNLNTQHEVIIRGSGGQVNAITMFEDILFAGMMVAFFHGSMLESELFSVLAQQLQISDVLTSHRIFMILFRTLKELSTKRLTSKKLC
ncbi:hypothetical protein L2E82_10434 [Cichorium intybus]|uniref:Uncharacterized protein n=1 Tax=Cichorium intybus TaxID=13427 RepID=A0ACB9GBL0_CICIN|nr:hypothetical protein L2E82_10434 [Cichorium intybus]